MNVAVNCALGSACVHIFDELARTAISASA
jgi:hypothetical protein